LQEFSSWAAGMVLPVCCPTSRGKSLLGQRATLVCRANVETGATGLEPATSGVTGRRSNQLNYAPVGAAL
jgi:hypothetical protein